MVRQREIQYTLAKKPGCLIKKCIFINARQKFVRLGPVQLSALLRFIYAVPFVRLEFHPSNQRRTKPRSEKGKIAKVDSHLSRITGLFRRAAACRHREFSSVKDCGQSLAYETRDGRIREKR